MNGLVMPAGKPVLRTQNCGNCRHAVQVPGQGAGCRRFPPTTFLISTPKGPQAASAWPPVSPDQWCGEWKTKIEGAP